MTEDTVVRTVNTRARNRAKALTLGRTLERELQIAMAEVGIRSVSELAREAHIQRDTLYKWFRGEQTPTPDKLSKVAGVVNRRVADLWNYDAEEPAAIAPPPDMAGLVLAVTQLVAEMREDRERGQDAAAAMLQAAKALAKAQRP